jgi:type IV pilus assembly protein PilZ
VPDPATDRRAETRWPVDIDVDYRIEGTYLFASIIDISALGIFVCTDDPLPQGTRLHLRFTPPVELGAPAASSFELEGEVVWVSHESGHTGMGVRFLNVDLGMHQRLLELVRAIAYLDVETGN